MQYISVFHYFLDFNPYIYIYIFLYIIYIYVGSEPGSIHSMSFKLSCFHPGLPGMYLGFYLLMQSTESRVGTSEVRMIRCKIFVWEVHGLQRS